MAVKHLTDANVDGTVFGQSASDLISLYGVTPVVQPAATAQSAVATTAITSGADTTTEFTAVTDSLIARVAALTTLVNQIRSDLVTFGVIKGSA